VTLLYALLKWLHVLAAIVVVGAHASYGVWIVRASNHREALPFTLRNIKLLDERVAIPAIGVQLVTGFAMAFIVRAWLSAPWLIAALVLFVVVVLTHLLAYRPVLSRMIDLLDGEGMESASYPAAAGREMRLGITMVVLMVVIVFLMVVKPALWA
jgi:uncharacterized membrane protein